MGRGDPFELSKTLARAAVGSYQTPLLLQLMLASSGKVNE